MAEPNASENQSSTEESGSRPPETRNGQWDGSEKLSQQMF